MSKRKLTQDELEAFVFLNDLRLSGVTNMFGASPYLEREFDMDKSESKRILLLWMNNFHEDSDAYESLLI